MQRQDLERLSREELIAEAERLGVGRPRTLTQPELVDEILGRTTKGDRERARVRGWLGRARDLLARVVERGLHLPEAARALRRESEDKGWPTPPPPLPTVTLAEIYAAQGHLERALSVLEEVLTREPDHKEARAMHTRFLEQSQRSRARTGRETNPPPPEPASQPASQETKPSAPAEQAPAAPIETPSGATTHAAVDPVEAAEEPEAPTLRRSVPAPPLAVALEVESAPEAVTERSPDAARERSPDAARERSPDAARERSPATVPPPAEARDEQDTTASSKGLEDPPLPDRYEVDEIVAIAVDPRTIYLYWEVRPTTLARARAAHAEGQLAVRVATVVASWEGPIVEARDMPVDALYGDRFVRDVKPGSNVRVSVGWLVGRSFEPFAVGAEVTAPRVTPVESVAQEIARWEAAPVVAAFAQRGAAFSPHELPAGRAPEPPAALLWPRPPGRRDGGSPVDTGVMQWTGPLVDDPEGTNHRAAGADEPTRETFETPEAAPDLVIAIGSSDLVRLPRTRTRTREVLRPAAVSSISPIRWAPTPWAPLMAGSPAWAPPGASELSR